MSVQPIHVALVGNPNCGKTSLFNRLTGGTKRVGNWPGVTVECETGYFYFQDKKINLIDLPGIYSLDPLFENEHTPQDEHIAHHYLFTEHIDIIINVVDASHLERHLYLTTQLLATGLPIIIALNKMDVAKKRGIDFDLRQFTEQLKHPVIPIIAKADYGLDALKAEIADTVLNPLLTIKFPKAELAESSNKEETDILNAHAHYHLVDKIISHAQRSISITAPSLTARIDRVLLHRVLGIPIFFAVMYLLFYFAVGLGHRLQDILDVSSHTLFVDELKHVLIHWHAPEWLIVLLAKGVGGGINTIITFIPVLTIMFLFLSFLEDSGYMARAAFIMDRVTRLIGLPGKSFIPMILGFACNVPAVMAARSLGSRRDQILTVMMTPFMSCTARLAIYAVFAAAFFPQQAAPAIFSLYVLGIIVALLTGLLLRKTLLGGHATAFVMELPPYHWPDLKSILHQTWQRVWGFLWRAGKLILPVCVLIGVLNAISIPISIQGELNFAEASPHSIISLIGRELTPLFAPMGIQADNWPATVGLMTGILAKEVVIATLNALYNTQSMVQGFGGTISAFAYLIFVLLYFPCVSTIAVVARELGKKWACLSVAWSTITAYGLAVLFYQGATLTQHPLSSVLHIVATLGLIGFVVLVIHFFAYRGRQSAEISSATPQGVNYASACGKCRQCKPA